MNKSSIIDAMLETAHDLGLSQITIKEIETLGLSTVVDLDPSEIKAMRSKEKLRRNLQNSINGIIY